jgi:hypothetical protein
VSPKAADARDALLNAKRAIPNGLLWSQAALLHAALMELRVNNKQTVVCSKKNHEWSFLRHFHFYCLSYTIIILLASFIFNSCS